MEYKRQIPEPRNAPRLIIHGGAGNITPASLPPNKYTAYREALLTIVRYLPPVTPISTLPFRI